MLSVGGGNEGVREDDQLSLVGQDITEFNVAPTNAYSIRHLDLSYNLLEKVDGLQRFVGLRELILDNNNLSELALPILPFLHTLSLNKNRLHDLDKLLDKLAKCAPQLEYLSLLGNTACPNELVSGDEEDYQNYRYVVINKLKYLKFLDSRPVMSVERRNAENRMKFASVVRALHQEEILYSDEDDDNTPLVAEQDMERKAGFGKRSYMYKGKNSEGNKFISDNDL